MSNKTITSIYGEYKIIFLDEAHAREIAKWQYPSPYDFYNFHDNDETVKELLEESYYSVFDEQEELIGYLCFGSSARITTCEGFIFSDTALDIGLGMKPELCGKGLGLDFLYAGLAFAKSNLLGHKTNFRLSVAQFNERAIKLYSKAGFTLHQTVTHKSLNMPFYIMLRDTNI